MNAGEVPTGVNYKGGKIIRHALANGHCVAYANVQIAMDAPFHGEVACEEVRAQGRAETQFVGYSAQRLNEQLSRIFSYIRDKYPGIELVVQIARGRSAQSMEEEILNPLLSDEYCVFYGYRTRDYFPPPCVPFVFVNIGMFARLTCVQEIKPGDVCNLVASYDVFPRVGGVRCERSPMPSKYEDDKNILKHFDFPRILLYGIDDDMPFVTPESYTLDDFT